MSASPRGRPDVVTLGAGIALTLGVFAVYAATAYRTAPFWDAGEFIAASAILGIPHQPSTPLFVLLGRLAVLVPAGPVAFRINLLSAAATALAVLFTFLATERLARRAMARTSTAEQRGPAAFSITAGLAAGVLVAFSRTIWFNAIEAEVYALSSMIMALALFLVLRWADEPRAGRDDRVLLLVFYLLALSVAIHLGTVLVLPALLVFVVHALVGSWRRTAVLLAVLAGGLLLAAVVGDLAERMGAGAASLAAGLLTVITLALIMSPRFRRPGSILVLLLVLGLSVHLFLPLRARLDPMINEGEPDDWRSFWDTLSRAQYPPANPFVRRSAPGFQFDHMFLRYVREQWPLLPAPSSGAMPSALPGLLSGLLPLGAAAWAAWAQAQRDRSGFALLGVFALITGPGMVIYLNFSDNEVRERDYFFTAFYQSVAMWAGIGAGMAARALAGARTRIALPARPPARFTAGALAVLLALLPAGIGWREHDRRGDTIARDYAYNLLVPLPAGAILFTNGDNDTFPLWYLQEVEDIRKDVRVVNLSLLNTPWYMRQLRDYEPRVPIRLADAEIANLRPTLDPQSGDVLLVKDLAVRQILRDNQNRRPPYLAVTVPDRMGLDERLVMEGLAHRIHPEPTGVRVDLETCRRNVDQVFTPLRGILTPEGKTDSRSYRDETEIKLIQNYAAIHFYLAVEYERQGRVAEALAQAERGQEVSPGFLGNRLLLGMLIERQGDWARAETHYRGSIAAIRDDSRLNHRLGWVVAQQGRFDEAVPILKKAVEQGGSRYFDPRASLFEVYLRLSKVQEAVALFDDWLAVHPGDHEVREMRDRAARGELTPQAPGAGPRLD